MYIYIYIRAAVYRYEYKTSEELRDAAGILY